MDQTFKLPEEWYEEVARSRPQKGQPWYQVLVYGASQTTYVAERNLGPGPNGQPVEHSLLGRFFDKFSDGFYSNSREEN